MTCARGCCDTPAEHYRSLRVSSPDRSKMTKVTTERDSSVEVDVTEHWHDQQDVLVKPKSIRITREEINRGA
jgi:hypothetical protein